MIEVVGVRFKSGGKIYYFDPAGMDIPQGTNVIIDTARGTEFGQCAEGNHKVAEGEVVKPLRAVIRIATDEDEKKLEDNLKKQKQAFDLCQEKIVQHGLDMKLVEVEYDFEGKKILFFFTSEGRVDFRELVKDLAAVFKTRIELRQIGVRDEAKLIGGLGICGRPFCCSTFLDDFQPVSIKMAKTQNLSLNPVKISGTCGRLMCCLKYEQDAYEDLISHMPKVNSQVQTPDGEGIVSEVNLLRRIVKVRFEGQADKKLYRFDDEAGKCIAIENEQEKDTFFTPAITDTEPAPAPESSRNAETERSQGDQPGRRHKKAPAAAPADTAQDDKAPNTERNRRKSRKPSGKQGGQNQAGAKNPAANVQKPPVKKPQQAAAENKKPPAEGGRAKNKKYNKYRGRASNRPAMSNTTPPKQ